MQMQLDTGKDPDIDTDTKAEDDDEKKDKDDGSQEIRTDHVKYKCKVFLVRRHVNTAN